MLLQSPQHLFSNHSTYSVCTQHLSTAHVYVCDTMYTTLLIRQTTAGWYCYWKEGENTSDGAQCQGTVTLAAFQYSQSFMNILPQDLRTSIQSRTFSCRGMPI